MARTESDDGMTQKGVMASLKRMLDGSPRVKRTLKRLLGRSAEDVSSGYVELPAGEVRSVGRELEGAWQDPSLPARQRRLVESQLQAYRSGTPLPVFDALVQPLARLGLAPGTTLLEVGCSSGYYSEVLSARGIDVRYTGSDYSAAFVDLARRCYPALSFDVMDATRLGYQDGQFGVVVSGCCLLHILDYPAAIAETARVAGEYAVFHRTPVQHLAPTRHFTKQAYGVKTMEIRFNETELVRLFARHGLAVVDVVTIDARAADGDAHAVKTYVCRKVTG
jgi:SAM-dependent methyltransferase